MTKDEIKKALECCDSHLPSACGECPYCWGEECKDKLIADALTLITEQEKENEKQNSRVKYLKTRLANKMVLLSNVEDLYESETQKLKEEKQELKTALKQSEDNYSRAFERLKAQGREIGKLKDENEALKNDLINSEGNLNHITTEFERSKEEKKQAKIDVLNELKDKMFEREYMGVKYKERIFYESEIDDMIAEVQNGEDKG